MKIILLSYVNRSGSTYLANLLSISPQISVCPEAEILYDLFLRRPHHRFCAEELARISDWLQRDRKMHAWKLDRFFPEGKSLTGWQAFQSLLENFRDRHFRETELVLFKHSKLYRLYDRLSDDQKSVVFWINLIRDPLAVYASQKHTVSPKTGRIMSDNPLEMIDSWNEFTQTVLTRTKGNVLNMFYETLITQPSEVLGRLSKWLNLSVNLDIKNIGKSKYYDWILPDYKPLHVSINEPPQPAFLSKWHMALTPDEEYTLKGRTISAVYQWDPDEIKKPAHYIRYYASRRLARKLKYIRGEMSTMLRGITSFSKLAPIRLRVNLRKSDPVYRAYTAVQGLRYSREFSHVKYLVLFIGYPRSGSSTLASLLDAHKNMIISHEQNILSYFKKGYGKNQLFYLMMRNSVVYAKTGRYSAGYKGLVEGGYNGKHAKPEIIGDKKAGRTTNRLAGNPEVIRELQKSCGIRVKCLHIIRNPFDMIATQSVRSGKIGSHAGNWDLDKAIDFCFDKFDTIQKIKIDREYDILDIRHEDLIRSPEEELMRILKWLEIETYPGYIEACARHLYDNPHKSRHDVHWTNEQQEQVQQKINEIPFLRNYDFSS